MEFIIYILIGVIGVLIINWFEKIRGYESIPFEIAFVMIMFWPLLIIAGVGNKVIDGLGWLWDRIS